MQVGDLIVTAKPVGQPAVLCVEGQKKFLAQLGRHKQSRALQILRPIQPTDRV